MQDIYDVYGCGQHPPYSLYQAEDGKWGLIDGTGKKLPAKFKRVDDRFSQSPWEVVVFNEQEGFELLAWYDPHEVWFNFTWENPAYPAEFAGLLWKSQQNDIKHYRALIYKLIPAENHWLLDEIFEEKTLERSDDDEFYWSIDAMLCSNPELENPAITNPMLDPVMRNAQVDKDVKIALWRSKVSLDSHIRIYREDYPEGM